MKFAAQIIIVLKYLQAHLNNKIVLKKTCNKSLIKIEIILIRFLFFRLFVVCWMRNSYQNLK